MPPRDQIGIQLTIRRQGKVVFSGQTGVSQMARSFEDLIGWLGRDNSFPDGVLLTTIPAEIGFVKDVAFTPDGQLLLSAGTDGLIKVWTVPDGS